MTARTLIRRLAVFAVAWLVNVLLSPLAPGAGLARAAERAGGGVAPIPSLRDFLLSAQRRARRVTIARADLDAAVAGITRAQGVLLPNLAASASYARNQYEAVVTFPAGVPGLPSTPITITPFNQLEANLGVNVPLVDITAWKRLKQAQANGDAARASLRATEDDVLLTVVRLYVQAVAAQERLRSNLRAEATTREDLAYNEARRSAGAATDLTVNRAKLEVARAEQLTADARRTLAQTLRNLATLSGAPEPTQVMPLLVDLSPPDDEIGRIQQAIRLRPEAVQARANLEVARQVESESRMAFVPTFGFNFNERITNATGFANVYASFTAALTLRFSLDVTRFANLRANEAQTRASHARLLLTLDDVRDSVHNARLDVEAGLLSVRAAREAERVAVQAAELARVQYRLGAATQRDVIDGERDRVRAEADRAQTEADLIYNRLSLERASGANLIEAAARIPLGRLRPFEEPPPIKGEPPQPEPSFAPKAQRRNEGRP